MDFGDVWLAFGMDLQLLQGAVNDLYRKDPSFSVYTDPNGVFRLELVIPQIETRPPCPPREYRLGIHLVGTLYVTGFPNPGAFDAWIGLELGVGTDENDIPVGTLTYDSVENVTPEGARAELEKVFAPDGFIGKVLADLDLPVFEPLLESATRVIRPPVDPDPDDDEEPPVVIDPAEFAVDLWLGNPAPIRRPVYAVENREPVLVSDFTEMTVPAIVATVALAGTSARMANDPSIVRPRTGLQLVTTKAMFDAKLDLEEAATIDTETEGVTIDHLVLEAVDGGITVDGDGHKTGATVTFEGTVVAVYTGGPDGHLVMRPAVHTDVDTDWWVDLLSVLAIVLLPGLGLILVDVLVWDPADQAPGKLDKALQEKFTEPLVDAANQLAAGFGVDEIPALAFLADVWVFDGNLGVAATAFLGYVLTSVQSVTRDVAYVGRDKFGDARPVTSVETIRFATGQLATPWQAAELVDKSIVKIPGHHVVHNVKARGGLYLRSNPNNTTTDNLLR